MINETFILICPTAWTRIRLTDTSRVRLGLADTGFVPANNSVWDSVVIDERETGRPIMHAPIFGAIETEGNDTIILVSDADFGQVLRALGMSGTVQTHRMSMQTDKSSFIEGMRS